MYGKLALLVFLMMSGFVIESVGQVTCNSIELTVGSPVAQDCFVSRVPVWFAYGGGNVPAPTFFTACPDFQLQGQVAGAIIENIDLQTSIYGIQTVNFTQGQSFGIHAFNSGMPMDFPFGDVNNPLFYVDVVAGSGGDFTLNMDMLEFYFNTGCAGLGCAPSYGEGTPSLTAPIVSACAGNNAYDLDFFVDMDDAVYDPITNESTVWVKARTGIGANASIPVNRLGLELTIEDVSGNLEILELDQGAMDANTDITGLVLVEKSGATFSADVILSGSNLNVHLNFTNSECKIFPITIKAPTEPLTAGVSNFNFDYTRVSFAYLEEGECCSPPSVNSTLNIDEYPSACNGGSVDFNLNIGSPSDAGCSGTVSIPVSFTPPTGGTTMDVNFYDINIEIDLTLEGDMAIDETATLNSLHSGITTAGSLIIDGTTIKLQFTGPTVLNTGTDLFTIELNNPNAGVGALTDIRVRRSEYRWYEGVSPTDVCVAPLVEGSPNVEEAPSCLGQHGTILAVDGFPLEGLDVCLNTYVLDRASICILCANGVSTIVSTQTNSDGEFVIDHCDESLASLAVCSDIHDDWGFDISTGGDIIPLLRHILGIEPFEFGWQWVAADANDSKTVTTADMIVLRKIILGVYQEFPNQDNWVYVENDFDLDDLLEIPQPNNLSDINYYYPDLSKSNCNAGFTAVKIGDIDNSGLPQLQFHGNEENDKMYINITDMGILPNGKYGITFEPHVFQSIVGFELALKPDPLKLSYYTWQTRNLSDVDTDVFYHKDGTIRVAWYSKSGYGKYLNTGDGMFTIELNPEIISIYGVDDIVLDNTIIPAHAYRSGGKVYDIELVRNNGNPKSLQHNKPLVNKNDMWAYTSGEEIKLKVQVNESQKAEIRIFDAQGKQLGSTKKELYSGDNLLSIDYQNYWPSGVYFVQLKMKNEILSTKWIKQ